MPKIERSFTSTTVDFSVLDEPKSLKIKTGDAQWMGQVRESARKIYCSVKYTNRIQCAKEAKERSPITEDDDALSSSSSTFSSSSTCVEQGDAGSTTGPEAESAQLQGKLKRMEERIRMLEDENSLLAWYAHYNKGGSAESAIPSIDSILDEAKTAVLQQAAAAIKDAVSIQELHPEVIA